MELKNEGSVNIEQLVGAHFSLGGIWGLHGGGAGISWELPPAWLPSGVLGQLLYRLGWGEVDGWANAWVEAVPLY